MTSLAVMTLHTLLICVFYSRATEAKKHSIKILQITADNFQEIFLPDITVYPSTVLVYNYLRNKEARGKEKNKEFTILLVDVVFYFPSR